MDKSLYEKALDALSSLGLRPTLKAMDPNASDKRVDEEGEPSDKKLAEAGEEAAAGGQAGGDQPGMPVDPNAQHAEPDADNAGGPSDGDADNAGGDDDEYHEMDDDEIREMRKAFGLTDNDTIEEAGKNTAIPKILSQILGYMRSSDTAMKNLNAELAELKANHASGKGDAELRVTMKSVDERISALAGLIENLPRTAPAQAPKAITKAVSTEPTNPKRLSQSELHAIALSGKMSALDVARLNRENQNPASAGN